MRTRTEALATATFPPSTFLSPGRCPSHSSLRERHTHSDAKGYIDLHLPEHPRARANGYVAEHIVVWERHNERSLPEKWHIHHLNGIKDDNRIENLQAMPSREHMGYIASQSRRIQELEEEIRQLKALI